MILKSMKKLPVKTPARPAPKIPPHGPDARRIAFLYADLGLDQRTIARLLKTSIGAVERSVKARALVRHQPSYGPWSEALAREFAAWLGLTLPDVTTVDPEDVWTRLRVALRTEVPKKLLRDPKAWFRVDGFLADLPHRQKAADDRLARARLVFLHGDLGMNAPEIARVLDASWVAVRKALDREKLHRNERAHAELNEALLTTLARALGRDEWPILRVGDYYRYDRNWSIVRRGTTEGLLRLASERRLDLAVLDQFIAAIPELAARRRTRFAGSAAKHAAPETPAPTRKNAA